MATVLSILAISISGLTFLWTIGWSIYTHRSATRPEIVVEGSFSIPVYGPDLGEPTLNTTATNTGSVTVTLTSARFRIRGQKETLAPVEWVVQTPRPLPVVLAPGEHWTGLADLAAMRDTLVRHYGPQSGWRLRPVVSDSANREYESRRWLDLSGVW